MQSDWIERDRLLSEVHSDVKNILKWTETHEKQDNDRFKDVNNKINWGFRICIVVAIVVVANGGMEAIRVLFNIK